MNRVVSASSDSVTSDIIFTTAAFLSAKKARDSLNTKKMELETAENTLETTENTLESFPTNPARNTILTKIVQAKKKTTTLLTAVNEKVAAVAGSLSNEQ